MVWLATGTSRIRAQSATAAPVQKKGVVDFYEILGVRLHNKVLFVPALIQNVLKKHLTHHHVVL